MSSQVLAYHGGKKPETPEKGAKQGAKWQADTGALGDAVVSAGTPLGISMTVSSDGASTIVGRTACQGFLSRKPTAWMLLSKRPRDRQ